MNKLPSQPPIQSQSPWDVIIGGLPHRPAHKCWTELNVPTHLDSGIHSIILVPLRLSPDSLPWIKWLFGLCWRPGSASYQIFWSQAPSRRACRTCRAFHNASINATLSFCDSHHLRHAWLTAWNHHPLVLEWSRSLSSSDRILLGKACIPRTLYDKLASHLGRQHTRRFIFSFQRDVIPLLLECLDTTPSPVALCSPPPEKEARLGGIGLG